MQISTPMPGQHQHQQQQQQQAFNMSNTSFGGNLSQLNPPGLNTTQLNGIAEGNFSPLHNALYLYMARILRPMWGVLLLKEEIVQGNKQVKILTLPEGKPAVIGNRPLIMFLYGQRYLA